MLSKYFFQGNKEKEGREVGRKEEKGKGEGKKEGRKKEKIQVKISRCLLIPESWAGCSGKKNTQPEGLWEWS